MKKETFYVIAVTVVAAIGGLGIGSAAVLSPLYIAEISPARICGALVSVNQMAIVTGILLACFINWISAAGPSNWR
jgi:SP family arabinose:H+ symporter-like MFS transporter